MVTENMIKKMIEQWIKEHQDELEKAKKQIEYWEDVIEREENYITYLNSFNNL